MQSEISVSFITICYVILVKLINLFEALFTYLWNENKGYLIGGWVFNKLAQGPLCCNMIIPKKTQSKSKILIKQFYYIYFLKKIVKREIKGKGNSDEK